MPRHFPLSPLVTALAALAASACTWGAPAGPFLTAVTPTEAPSALETSLRITGSSFEPEVLADLDRPGQSDVDASFTVTLVSGSTRIDLGEVERLSSSELSATLAAGAAPGLYDVEVRDPRGKVGSLPAAFVVYVPMPPRAKLAVSPGGGTVDATLFTLDASGSADDRHPLAGLEFRFDANGNGSWSSWRSSPIYTFTYESPGTYTAAVEARDTFGLHGWATALVVVATAGTGTGSEVRVTTALDESDAGASPTTPGGTGLSLREAVTWVNAQGSARTITFAGPMTITMTPPQTYMTLSAPGAAIVGERGVVLDFGGINQPCLTLDAGGQKLVGVELRGCVGNFVTLSTASAGSQVAQVQFTVNTGPRYWAYGIVAKGGPTPQSLIGPGNVLTGLWIALKIDGTGYQIVGNDVVDNAVGALLGGTAARVWGNTFARQVAGGSNKGISVQISNGAGPVEILSNTFDRSGGPAIDAAAVASLTVRDNLFTNGGALGLNALPAGLTHDHNGYFGNAGGAVAAGLATGATDLLADPLYADAAGGDYRLLPGSPARDAGVDVGLDLNGAAPGNWSGLAPDLGAFEAP